MRCHKLIKRFGAKQILILLSLLAILTFLFDLAQKERKNPRLYIIS